MEGLQRFANHTRHRPARDGDLTMLGRKWLVTHVAPVSAETYAFVAQDYQLVEARTHSPPLASYAESSHPVDVDTFVWLTKNGYPAGRPLTLEEEQQWPALAQFRDTLWPKPVDQEAWHPFERRDHWKERAYFLAAAGACKNKPQFYALVQKIFAEDATESSTVDSVSDLYTRILRTTPQPSAQELGTLIAALDLGHMQNDGPSCEEARQKYLQEVESKVEHEEEQVTLQPIVLTSTTTNTVVGGAVVEDDDAVLAFRQRELIPPTFPSHKVMQQMVLAHLQQPVPAHLLSSVQRRGKNKLEPPAALGDAVWTWLSSIPAEKLAAHLDLNCPQLQSYYFGGRSRNENAGQPIAAHALVQGVITDVDHRKLWPLVEPSVVKTIMEI
jgi:hypothetical protein